MNIKQLKSDIKNLNVQILVLKKALRSPWRRPMDQEQVELIDLKESITELFVLRAHHRGKCHLLGKEGLCLDIVSRLASRYERSQAA